MTAPTRTKNSTARPAQRERQQEGERSEVAPAPRARSAAADKAYARKRERGQRWERTQRREQAGATATQQKPAAKEKTAPKQKTAPKVKTAPKQKTATQPAEAVPQRSPKPAPQDAPQQSRSDSAKRLQAKLATARAPFVVAVMVVLTSGIAGTLGLSIAAIGNAHQLERAQQRLDRLAERKEELLRDVSELSSTGSIKRRAEQIGMVSGTDPAALKKRPGSPVKVIGEPTEAKAPKPAKPAPEQRKQKPQQQDEQDNQQRHEQRNQEPADTRLAGQAEQGSAADRP